MTTEIPHVNDALIAELQQMMEGDFELLVSAFVNDSKSRLLEIKKTLDDANSEDFRDACHSLKGSASNIGVERLAELCRQGEEKGDEEDWTGVPHLLQEIEDEFRLISELLQDKV